MRNTLKNLLSSIFVAAFLAGCGENVPTSQEAQEQELENYAAQFGADIDVDMSRGTPQVSFNQNLGNGTVLVGNNLNLPADFPDDVAMFPDIQILSVNTMPLGYMVQAQVAASHDDITAFYAARMVADGWTDTTSDVQSPAMRSLTFEKADRRAAVNLLPTQPNTTLQITVLTLG
ncbi:MAG: hypothetical protein R3F50_01045 [Gammaproteobacteria bacterium]|jgi:hypothetical protein